MPNQVPYPIRKGRNAVLRAAFAVSASAYRARFLGQTLPVLWESTSRYGENGLMVEGLTDNYLRVRAYAPEPRWNQVDAVCLTGLQDDGMTGKLINTVLHRFEVIGCKT